MSDSHHHTGSDENRMILSEEILPHVRAVTINRPSARNALNRAALRELHAVLVAAARETGLRVLILTGAGEQAFAAGSDIKEMMTMNAAEAAEFSRLGHDVGRCLEEMSAVVIAAINGIALGSGTELALASDLVCIADHGVMGLPEAGLGVIPGHGGTARLERWVGPARARELLLTGRKIPAEEALRLGLAHHVVAGPTLPFALEWAKSLLDKSPHALSTLKSLLRRQGVRALLPQALEEETNGFAACFGTPDQIEGMQAFREKRAPAFGNPRTRVDS